MDTLSFQVTVITLIVVALAASIYIISKLSRIYQVLLAGRTIKWPPPPPPPGSQISEITGDLQDEAFRRPPHPPFPTEPPPPPPGGLTIKWPTPPPKPGSTVEMIILGVTSSVNGTETLEMSPPRVVSTVENEAVFSGSAVGQKITMIIS